MSTVTMPEELARQLLGLEPRCMVLALNGDHWHGYTVAEGDCPNPAAWIVTVVGPCGHPQSVALCDAHHAHSHRRRPLAVCSICRTALPAIDSYCERL